MSYYHEITVGFNWWFVLAPLFVVLEAVIGWRSFALRGGEIRRVKHQKLVDYTSAMFAVIVAALVLIESADGIVQWFDNRTVAGESPVWNVGAVPFVALFVGLIYWGVLVGVGRLFSLAKAGRLLEERQRQHRKVRRTK